MTIPPNPPPLAQPKTSSLAVTSLVLAVLGIVMLCFAPLLAIPAIICGHVAMSRINGSGGALTGKGLAIAGFTIGYVSLFLLLPLLLAIAIPNFVRARQVSMKNACINNLRQIDGAKQQWALENSKQHTDTPTQQELMKYLGRQNHLWPTCPARGVYTINAVGEAPTCSIPEHQLP